MKNIGLYLGSEVGGKWWKRYSSDGLLMRGNGTYWHDNNGFYFLRYLTKEPIFVPFKSIVEIKLGKWHSGRWAYGNLIVKIIWERSGVILSSGFIISSNKEDAVNLKESLTSAKDKFKQ